MDSISRANRSAFPTAQSPQSGGAQQNDLDIETVMRRSRDKAAFMKERDHVELNNLSFKYAERAEKLERHLELMHAMDNALGGKASPFSKFTSELDQAINMKGDYRDRLERETDYRKTSWTTQGWNLVAGGNGFLLCFGIGTLTASALGKPWAALAISPLLWSVTERFIPMIRATSWQNRHADVDYAHIMRVSARAVRDWLRQMFGLNPKKYLVKGEILTASQYRQTLSLFNAWKGKVATDDLPYFSYTFWYSVRSIVLNLCTTPAFLKTPVGVAVSLVSLGVAGILAGASTSWIFQTARRHAYRKENPDTWRNGETIVKSPDLWRAERKLLEAKIKLLDAYEIEVFDADTKESIAHSKKTLEKEIYKASMKSRRLTSIVYEISCLLQKKDASGENGLSEVAGNRIAFLCGLLGKAACLVPAILFNQLVALKYTSAEHGLAIGITVALFLNTLLIMGFSFRKELEFPWRYMLDLTSACVDVINKSCGIEDKYENNDMVATQVVIVEKNPGSNTAVARSESSIDEDTNVPMRQVKVDRNYPDGTSVNDETSSEST